MDWFGFSAGLEAVVAARSRGFTPTPWEVGGGPNSRWGVLVPVPMGVVRLEGSSDVNIVAEDGEMRYLEERVDISASLKPVRLCKSWFVTG